MLVLLIPILLRLDLRKPVCGVTLESALGLLRIVS